MRYSKLIFVFLLTLILVFGSSMSAFATSAPNLTVSVYPDPSGTVYKNVEYVDPPGWNNSYYEATIEAYDSIDGKFVFCKWQEYKKVGWHWEWWQKVDDYDWVDTAYTQSATFPIEHNMTLRAVFCEKFMYTYVLHEPEMGTYSGTPSGYYLPDTMIMGGAEFADGYELTGWKVDEGDMFGPEQLIMFNMPSADAVLHLYFDLIPSFNVTTMVDQEGTGTTTGDGSYQIGDTVELTATPIDHYHFVEWNFGEMELETTPGLNEGDISFKMPDGDVEGTATFAENEYVWATPHYLDNNDNPVQPSGEPIKVYLDEEYLIPHPNTIGSYVFAYTLNDNDEGIVSSEMEYGDFDVYFHYYIPQVITNTVTETVVVTQTVTVPATTEATTEAVIPEEETPLGAAMIGFNFDEILEPVPVVEETPEELLPVEETPLGDALPQTGQLPADLFYGIGGLVSAMGVYLKRRK